MRILFFICSLKLGGTEKACVRLANALAERQHDVTIQTIFGGGCLTAECNPRIHVRHIFPTFIRGIARVSGFLPASIAHRLYIHGSYDVEIAAGHCLEAHVVSGSPNPRRYCWLHMVLDHPVPASLRHRYGTFKRVICVSQTTQKAFERYTGLMQKAAVAFTPVDAGEVRCQAEKTLPPLPPNTLLAVGRLENIKGYDCLIEAIRLLSRQDFQVHIIGEGTQHNALQRQIDLAGLSTRVILVGPLENPYPLMKSAAAVICPSRSESFGFTGLEAMLLGTPVIATQCGGYEEIITSPDEGILCGKSPADIAKAIQEFLDGRRPNEEAARRRAETFCSNSHIRHFEEILA